MDSRTGAPQPPQNRSLGWVAGAGGGARTTGVPQKPQNFSVSATGFPQPRQTDSVAGGGTYTGGGGGGAATGTATGTGSSLTIAQHLLQNLSPGLIGFPHDRQDLPDAGCTGAVFNTGCETGGETIGDTGAGAGFTVIEAPHSPQNFISIPITALHAGQERVDGEGGTGISGTTGATSFRVEPQLPQNFSSRAPMVPHDWQTGGFGGCMGISTGSGTGCETSASEAPQCRQNFAFGTLLCPHSGQYTIIISTELLAGIHKIGTGDPVDRTEEQIHHAPFPEFYFFGAGKKIPRMQLPVRNVHYTHDLFTGEIMLHGK